MASPQDQAAQRLYARLRARDPKALRSAKKLATLARKGNPTAVMGALALKKAHARAVMQGRRGRFGAVASAPLNPQLAAAKRLYVRLAQRDPSAASAVRGLLARAKKGEPKSRRALELLKRVHESRSPVSVSGYKHLPSARARMGEVSPERTLSPERTTELLSLVQQARFAL